LPFAPETALSQIERSVLLPYTVEQLFALVSDIPSYPAFLPYCLEAKVLSQQASIIQGLIRVGYKGLGYNFTTQNTEEPPQHIHMKLLSGPFHRLEGDWIFEQTPNGTWVRLKLTIVFKNPVLGLMFKHKIDELTDTVVAAFIKRAREIY
jgi:ribosome-associated toxin RatA of RatAB toxin-antitoxin module